MLIKVIDIIAVILLVYGINRFFSAFNASIINNLTSTIKTSKMANYSSLDPQNPKDPYTIVQFEGTDEKGKLCIDLVLKKWFTTRGKKNMCKYPPEAHYYLRDQFLEEFKTPEKSWSCVPYTFIIGAENLQQGRRRLNRAQFTKDCQTTDNEGEKSAKVLSLSKSQITDILRKRVPMHSNSVLPITDTPTGTRLKSKSRFSKIQKISSDTDSENEHISSNSTDSSPSRKSYKISSFHTSNREKLRVNYPKNNYLKKAWS